MSSSLSNFAEVEKLYDEEIYHFCMICVQDAKEATMCQKRAVRQLVAAWDSMGGNGQVRDFLYQAARNECLNWLMQKEGWKAEGEREKSGTAVVNALREKPVEGITSLGMQVVHLQNHLGNLAKCAEGYELTLVNREDPQDMVRLDSRFAKQADYLWHYQTRVADQINELNNQLRDIGKKAH